MQPKPRRPQERESVDIRRAVAELRGEEAYGREGHTARTIVREPDLRVVLISVRAGGSVDEHRTDHTSTLQVIAGKVRVRFADCSVEVGASEVFVLEPDVTHAFDAIEDSTLLLTLGWRDKNA